jgi:hypothetical protein
LARLPGPAQRFRRSRRRCRYDKPTEQIGHNCDHGLACARVRSSWTRGMTWVP